MERNREFMLFHQFRTSGYHQQLAKARGWVIVSHHPRECPCSGIEPNTRDGTVLLELSLPKALRRGFGASLLQSSPIKVHGLNHLTYIETCPFDST